MQPKRSGNSGRYFRVRNWLSEKGLSSDTCGRLCVFVTPISASQRAKLVCDFFEVGHDWQGSGESLNRLDVLFLAAFLDQSLSQLRAFAISDHPAGDVTAEDIEDHVQVEIGPFRGAE